MMATDEKYMHRSLELAVMGKGEVAPNPMVGAVIVHDGKIIGEGYHQKYGHNHAEVIAIQSVTDQDLLKGSTLYVNLEPCSHHGKTPPCTDSIIEKGIPKVVIGCRDPFDQVNGKGIELLREAGIEVIENILEAECRELNRRFFIYHQKKRPYIILKWAQSQDGYMDTNRNTVDQKPVKITDERVDILTHQWRSEEAAIVVGARTVLMDNPRLTVRLVKGNNPARVVIDPEQLINGDYHIFDQSVPTYVFRQGQSRNNVNFIDPERTSMIDQVCTFAHKTGWTSIYVEGGSYTLEQFLLLGKWDEIRVITRNDLFLGDGIPAPKIPAVPLTEAYMIGDQHIQVLRNYTTS